MFLDILVNKVFFLIFDTIVIYLFILLNYTIFRPLNDLKNSVSLLKNIIIILL